MEHDDNIAYDNQRIYCKQNNVPFFASQGCNHRSSRVSPYKGEYQTLTEMLKEKYGDEPLLGGTFHIVSCPICGWSWCD